MRRYLVALALASSALSGPVFADVGVSVQIGQPGYHGRLEMGDYYPPPALIYERPVVIQQVPVHRSPVYMYVPENQARHWSHFCHQYSACGDRVYFVRDEWYRQEYIPRYHERHAYHRDHRRGDRSDDNRHDWHDRNG